MTSPTTDGPPPRYTIAICTWNRAALLRRTLESLARLEPPADGAWEVLVVDNASTDATPQVLAELRDRLPLRALREPRPGVSHARNTAVEHARGEVIVWTDDDVLVEPDWLRVYDRAIRAHPEAVFFGGPIIPRFEGATPPHLPAALARAPFAYAHLDHGPEPGPLLPEPRRWAFTANMAIRRDVQRQLRYDPALGRRRSLLVGGEDTTLIRTIWNQGRIGWWVPEARVHHVIPPDRQTVAFLRRYFRGKGAQQALHAPPEAALLGLPRWAIRQAVRSELRYRVHRLTSAPEVWVEDLQRAATAWGLLRQRWADRREPHDARTTRATPASPTPASDAAREP